MSKYEKYFMEETKDYHIYKKCNIGDCSFTTIFLDTSHIKSH
jgi:hypothetical protein